MAGVTAPMLRQRPGDGARFLAGFAVGGIVAALLIATLVYGAGSAALQIASEQDRLLLLAGIFAALGVADLLDRTPHVWRQVPQALIRVLAPGRLGTIWGFDVGLHFTTQKVTSLVWAALAAVALADPSAAPLVAVAIACVMSATIAAWSIFDARGVAAHGSRGDRLTARVVRSASGLLLLGICLPLLTRAL